MSGLRDRIKYVFSIFSLPLVHEAIAWWEVRRLLYNLLVMPAFVLCAGLSLALCGLPWQRPGLAVIVLGVVFFTGANAAYTLGWITEIVWSGGQTSITRPYRRGLFWAGVVLSLLLCLIPFFGVLFLCLAGALA